MKHRIAILIPYFGEWPVWINFFIESCRANPTIDWFLFNHAEPPENRAPNVRHIQMQFDEYKDLLSDALGVRVAADRPYKLCDVRPALPYVHSELVRGYDFVGTGDIDVIYGDIRSFYDSSVLEDYDLLSSHSDRVSGHFCLIRNTEEMTTVFKTVRGWKKVFSTSQYLNFDERALHTLFRGKRFKFAARLRSKSTRCLFREAYSTPAPTDRMRWFWEGGRLTNEFYPHHPFMYLHFMNWHSDRWFAGKPGIGKDAAAPWARLGRVVQVGWREAAQNGFTISPTGIQPIIRPFYDE